MKNTLLKFAFLSLSAIVTNSAYAGYCACGEKAPCYDPEPCWGMITQKAVAPLTCGSKTNATELEIVVSGNNFSSRIVENGRYPTNLLVTGKAQTIDASTVLLRGDKLTDNSSGATMETKSDALLHLGLNHQSAQIEVLSGDFVAGSLTCQ